MSKLTLIIPSYNEKENLKSFLPTVIEFCNQNRYNLVLVDDGSDDNSNEIYEKFYDNNFFKIVRHSINMGYGAALKSGFENSNTQYSITIDADGQHNLNDINKLLNEIENQNADLVIGCRIGDNPFFRSFGKSIIRTFAKLLMDFNIRDLNSGMKIYKTQLVKKYITFCPNNMAFSDIITLIFIYKNHKICEIDVEVKRRIKGKSTINFKTAFDTMIEILNIITFFSPLKIFLPVSFILIIISIIWAIPFLILGKGLSTGALLGILVGVLLFFMGLLSEQISQIRKKDL